MMEVKVLSRIFSQMAFIKAFKEKNPKCVDCTHVNELAFDRQVYQNWVLVKECPSCPKFDGEIKNVNA